MAAAVVVGSRFCVPRVLPLTLTMNLARGATVTDASGAVLLRADVSLLRHRFVLVGADGRPLLTVQRKAFRWDAFRGDSSDLLFTARRHPAFQMRTQMGIFLASNTARKACDFQMKCSGFAETCCDLYLGNSDTKIAHMRRELSGADVLLGKATFSVTVFPNVDYAFIAALAVMLHEIHMTERMQAWTKTGPRR